MLDLRRAVGLGILFTAAFSIAALEPGKWFEYSPEGLEDFLKVEKAPARAWLAGIQSVACVVLALLTPRPKISGGDTAGEACRRIQLLVAAVFLGWALYYAITGVTLVIPRSDFDQAILVTFNIVPSVLLFWLYLELAEVTVEGPDSDGAEKKADESHAAATPDAGRARSIHLTFYRVVSLGVFALITVPVWIASGREDGVAAVSREEATASFIRNSFDMLSSCLNGVALALVVGRLGSKIISLGSVTLGFLYFYAVIQPTAPTFHNQAIAQVLATTAALPLKVLLWLVFVWAYTTGTLAEYVSELRIFVTRGHLKE